MTYGISAELAAEVRWGATFRRWAKPLSDSEEAKAERAAHMIRQAIAGYSALAARNVEVYPTGSYWNNTNVRGESDVDVAVVCHDTIFYDLPLGWTADSFGITQASYSFAQFRRDVHNALLAHFGSGVSPGDKTFNVSENTYRMEADVTPFFEYRQYRLTPEVAYFYEEGVKSYAASGVGFVNWHEDHYREGVARNTSTRRRFKRIARILKNIKFDMIENGALDARLVAEKIPSFLAECLVYNAADACFNRESDGYVEDVKSVIADLWNTTKPDGSWTSMLEVNRRKRLFLDGQSWQRDTVHSFLSSAWGHLF